MSLSHDYPDETSSAVMEEAPANLPLTEEDSLVDPAEEESLPEKETAKLVADVATTLWARMEQSEKNAVDVASATDQLIKLSDREQYKKAMDTIFNDPTISAEEKLRLKAEVDKQQSLKDELALNRITTLQASQSRAINDVHMSYVHDIAVGAIGASLILLLATPKGRIIFSKAATWLVKEGPHLIRHAV